VPDAFSYSLLMNYLCEGGDLSIGGKIDKAYKLLHYMQKKGFVPDAFSYSLLINCLCERSSV
jgi:pentatricopeptide repeat protein